MLTFTEPLDGLKRRSMQIADIYKIYLNHPQISTDTRKIESGSIFLALKGANFNGNEFAEKAIGLGAAYAIVDDAKYKTNERMILVPDALTTLQELARFHRDQLNIPVIGITGTNGKTTTKELIYSVLKEKFHVFATQGNLNNHIGVPLSILSIGKDIEVAVVEMGANHIGEIAFLCSIAKPDYGLITNVGRAHLEGFGSYEGVKKAKGELYSWLSSHNGTLFIQQNNEELMDMAGGLSFKERIGYGFSKEAMVSGHLVENNPFLRLKWKSRGIENLASTQLTGAYNTENILAAVCIGTFFGLTEEEINRGVSSYQPMNNRSQVLNTDRNTLICDYYNANVSSMKAALENLRSIQTDLPKVAILGDMFELGDDSSKEHKNLIELAGAIDGLNCLFIGSAFFEHKSEDYLFFKTTDAAREWLLQSPLRGQLILLKASRGMAFEQLISVL